MKRVRNADIFRAVADFTYDWESWIDVGGKTAWVNPAVERMTGYTVEECLEMPRYPLPILHPDDRAHIAAALEAPSGNDVEMRIVHKSGEVRWLAISWQPIVVDGKSLGYRTSVRDIRERKKVEEALREAKQRAEDANRAKGEFLAMMSHEIRSPMQAISGYSQLLALTELTPEQNRLVGIILRENESLLRIVNDVLDFSSLQSGRVAMEQVRFDYRELVESVLDAVRPRATEKGIKLRGRVDPSVPSTLLGDPHRHGQILRNLVDNAIKFTVRGGVSVGVKTDADTLVTRVTDTGPGIPKKARTEIFDMFRQADSSTARHHGGAGLGLAICSRLCEAMGGSISLHSTSPKGSTFVVRLPLHRAVSKAATAPLDVARGPRLLPLRILVVDDSAVARDVARGFLQALGYEPDVASSGSMAVRKARKNEYDLVLLDMQMPGLDGVATAEALRGATSAPLTIAALTANVFVKPSRNIDVVLTKPLQLASLRSFLSEPWFDGAVIDDLLTTRDGKGRPLLDAMRSRVEREARAILKALDGALPGPDCDRARHSLKGLALLVGARKLAACAEKASVPALREELRRTLVALDSRLAGALGKSAV